MSLRGLNDAFNGFFIIDDFARDSHLFRQSFGPDPLYPKYRPVASKPGEGKDRAKAKAARKQSAKNRRK